MVTVVLIRWGAIQRYPLIIDFKSDRDFVHGPEQYPSYVPIALRVRNAVSTPTHDRQVMARARLIFVQPFMSRRHEPDPEPAAYIT